MAKISIAVYGNAQVPTWIKNKFMYLGPLSLKNLILRKTTFSSYSITLFGKKVE